MPRVGPGDDNITGDRYTLDLGVEPDLGNLLQNLQVANDLLDAAEQKFRDISDIVNSSTQRMAQFTRQTALAAAEAQRLQNSYSQIASSSFTLSNIGGMAMGAGGGMMPGMFPGQMAFGGMPPVSGGGGNMIQTMPSSVAAGGPPSEEFARFRPPPAPQRQNLSLLNANAIENITGRWSGGGSKIGQGVSAMKAGFQFRRHGISGLNPSVMAKLPNFGNAGLSSGLGAATAAKGAVQAGGSIFPSAVEAMGAGFAPEAITGLGAAGGAAGAAGSFGAFAGAAAPWALAGIAGYKLYTGQVAEARRLSGITGDTGIFSGVAGGGSAQLKARSLMMGVLHPGVDYGRVQEEAMGTGATGGAYTQTRDFLFEAAKRGMSDSIDMVDLYEEAISKAGGTTGMLTNSLDRMRSIASQTNSSLDAMAKGYKANMETAIAMGMSGGAANLYSNIQGSTFTQSSMAQMNPVLRNSSGYDITNPLIQAGITSQLGIGYSQLGIQSALNPGLGAQIPKLAEDVIIQRLKDMGFNSNMVYDDIIRQLGKMGGYPYAGQMLEQMGLLPVGTMGDDLTTTAEAILTIFTRPAAAATKELSNAAKPTEMGTQWKNTAGTAGPVGEMRDTGSNGVFQDEAGNYFTKEKVTADILMENFSIGGDGESDYAGIAEQYSQNAEQTNTRSPAVEAALSQADHGINTFVRNMKDPTKQAVRLDVFMKEHPDYAKLLDDPDSGWVMKTFSQDEAAQLSDENLEGKSAQEILKMVNGPGYSTGDEFAMGGTDPDNPNDVRSTGSMGEYDLGEKTLKRMEDIANAAADR